MGLLDKLLGGVILPPTTRTRTSSGSAVHRPAAPGAKGTHPSDRPVNPMRQPVVKPKPEETVSETEPFEPAAAPIRPAEPIAPAPAAPAAPTAAEASAAMTAEDILAELFAEPKGASAPDAAPSHDPGGDSILEAKGSMGSFVAEPVSEAAPVGGASAAAVTPTEASAVTAPVVSAEDRGDGSPAADVAASWSDVTQRKLDRYFARMRQAYPDGVIVRLNTGQKKLAERGAQLRREIGMEGRLDEFFALGEFTYQRSEGGRPSVVKTDRQQEGLLRDLQTAFPQGVPSAAVQQSDHRLYLNLRAAARRGGCTMTDYLKQHELLKKKECVS